MSRDHFSTWPNRTVCDVLAEMRKCYETRNFSYLLGLIEELQSLGNRMESALSDKNDVREWTEKRYDLKKEIKDLYAERKKIRDEIKSLKLENGIMDDE